MNETDMTIPVTRGELRDELALHTNDFNLRLVGLEHRFKSRFDFNLDLLGGGLIARLDRIDQRFAALDQRFAALEQRIDQRFTAFEQRLDQRFTAFEQRLESRWNADLQATEQWQETEIEALSDRVARLEAVVFPPEEHAPD